MALKEDFDKAAEDIKQLKTRPDNHTLLALYSLYKQATEGDAQGKRPGMLDLKGRAKYDAWATRKGTKMDKAKKQYIDLVKLILANSYL